MKKDLRRAWQRLRSRRQRRHGRSGRSRYPQRIEALVARGWADPWRISVTGTSYGGFILAWLPTLSDRFAAAVPISPVGGWYSQHHISQIPSSIS